MKIPLQSPKTSFHHSRLLTLILVWLLTIPAILPLMQPTLPHSADGLLHLYRVAALKEAVRQGQLFPRWLPTLAYGYGFPLLVYYAPLAYYLTLIVACLPIPLPVSLNLSFAAAALTAATGMYLWAETLLGRRAGLMAAVAYVYAPFSLTNSLFRGGLPAAWALAAFPLAGWLFTRLLTDSHPMRSPLLPLAALALAAALLMHNTLSLLFIPMLGLYLGLALSMHVYQHRNFRPPVSIGLALLLGVGLTAFFLLPALGEKQFAQVERVITSPDFDFRYHFVSPAELLALPPAANTGLSNPDLPFTLGAAHVALASIGLIVGLHRLKHRPHPAIRLTLLLAMIALAVSVAMMLPASRWLWELVPLLAFIQFPHRLLAVTAVALALLAGVAAAGLPRRAGFWLTAGGIGLLLLTATPLLYPRYLADMPAAPTAADMFAYERRSGAIGTTSFGEYLPIWVTQIPRESPLEPHFAANAPISRLDAEYLPVGAAIESASYGFNTAALTLSSPQPFRAVFHTFYFPGWQATVDGQPVPPAPFSERGLISVEVPAGRHRLELWFAETPLRQSANLLSGATLLITLALLAASLRRPPAGPPSSRPAWPGLSRQQAAIIAGLGLLAIGGKLLWLDRFDTPFKHIFDGTRVAEAGTHSGLNFGDEITLLGYALNETRLAPGQTFELTAYWQANRPLSVNYSAFVQLVDDQGHLFAGQDNLHPGGLPSDSWQPWSFTRDAHALTVPWGLPPGDYHLSIGLYEPATWRRLPALNGKPGWADSLPISVTITAAPQPPPVEALGIRWAVAADFGPELRLLGATPEREQIARNDFLRLALFWEALTAPTQNYQFGLRLVNLAGETVAESVDQPSFRRYPTTRWAAGERVRDDHALWIPADLPPGRYRLELQGRAENGAALNEWLALGELPLHD